MRSTLFCVTILGFVEHPTGPVHHELSFHFPCLLVRALWGNMLCLVYYLDCHRHDVIGAAIRKQPRVAYYCTVLPRLALGQLPTILYQYHSLP